MIDLLIYITAFFIMLPFLLTILLYILARKLGKNKIRAFHFSLNYSMFFYVFAVWAILTVVSKLNLIAEIIIFLLVLMNISVFIQWKLKGEVRFKKALKAFWRSSFLVFSILYFGLLVYGITINMLF